MGFKEDEINSWKKIEKELDCLRETEKIYYQQALNCQNDIFDFINNHFELFPNDIYNQVNNWYHQAAPGNFRLHYGSSKYCYQKIDELLQPYFNSSQTPSEPQEET